MMESHPFTRSGVCPCRIGADAIEEAACIFQESADVASFVREMERRRVIGKRIWNDAEQKIIFVEKVFACDSGGGCPENATPIGQRCHCEHFNRETVFHPRHWCKCGAEFYRPMFAPLFGERVRIVPYKTVLAGDDSCVLAVYLQQTEDEDYDT